MVKFLKKIFNNLFKDNDEKYKNILKKNDILYDENDETLSFGINNVQYSKTFVFVGNLPKDYAEQRINEIKAAYDEDEVSFDDNDEILSFEINNVSNPKIVVPVNSSCDDQHISERLQELKDNYDENIEFDEENGQLLIPGLPSSPPSFKYTFPQDSSIDDTFKNNKN